MKTETLSRNCA